MCLPLELFLVAGLTNSPNESTWDYALGVFIGLNVKGLISESFHLPQESF